MKSQSLFSKEFIIFNAVFFLAFINMAVLFRLHQYLLTLPIDPKWSGFLIGVFSLAGIFLQPLISPFIGPSNARRTLAMGVVITIGALLSYRWATSFGTLLAVRIIHGTGFITFVTAMNASIVSLIPVKRSAQAFGLVSINVLLPFAIVPALLDRLNLGAGDFVNILTAAAVLMVPAALLPAFVKQNGACAREPACENTGTDMLRNVVENLRDARISILLATNLLAFLAYAPLFFFLKEYAEGRGIANPGVFFTIATGTMIAIRVLGGHLFDNMNKPRMLIASLGLLSLAYVLLIKAAPGIFLVLAVLCGIGWGFFMPFLNALLFDCSKPSNRALNLNLAMVMLQAGYFVGPIVGGLILADIGYGGLFFYCGLMTFIGMCLNLVFLGNHRQ
ncbi:MAG: putative transporter [Syntrophorhabdaceae bacterium PtaU1.Bin034]|nr:MAG: putative transporter [Syntrophorhabdaceae bacterium PtaU1.Bin034]